MAANEIRSLYVKKMAERFTNLEHSADFRVIEFPTPKSGVGSPFNGNGPDFISGVRTAEGAPEYYNT